MSASLRFGHWAVQCLAEDGARLSSLCYKEQDLLTSGPPAFRPPVRDFGKFETRPVYGYDDCFPSVDSCPYPGKEWQVPDHGELCWLPWEVTSDNSHLFCRVRSQALPLEFRRELAFCEDSLTWSFWVTNLGNEILPFQHVMHPLMPPQQITGIRVPPFSQVVEVERKESVQIHTPLQVESWLHNQPVGSAAMLLLQGITEGEFGVTFDGRLQINVTFPEKLFPTLGIWWDNGAYPYEEGVGRFECAFEPISGSNSRLSEAHRGGLCLSVQPQETLSWEVRWSVEEL